MNFKIWLILTYENSHWLHSIEIDFSKEDKFSGERLNGSN